MNAHIIGFHQLVQKLQRIKPIISTLQDKQNGRSTYSFIKLVQRLDRIRPIISTLQDKQNGHSLHECQTIYQRFLNETTLVYEKLC